MTDSMVGVAEKLRDRAHTETDPVEAAALFDMADALDLCRDGIAATIAAGDAMHDLLAGSTVAPMHRAAWMSTSRQTQAQTFGTRPPSTEETA